MPNFEWLWTLFTSREAMATYVASWGVWGPAVFIFLQALQVLIAFIPGELTGILGGYIFGAPLGFLYSMVGLTIGSMATFGVGHLLGPPFLTWLLGPVRFAKFHALTLRAGVPVAFLLYVFPGFPKDVLGYVFGASNLSAITFLWVTSLARMPGTWVLCLQGAKAGQQAWGQLIAIAILAVGIGAIAYWYRDRLLAWVHHRHRTEE